MSFSDFSDISCRTSPIASYTSVPLSKSSQLARISETIFEYKHKDTGQESNDINLRTLDGNIGYTLWD